VADEIFLTGTGAQICPVIEVDHRPVGTGKIGALTETLQQTYHEVVRGMRPEYRDWLTPVYAKSHTKADHAVTAGKAASNGHNGNSAHNGHTNGHAKTRSGGKARTR
jgi:hypothetical protein